MAEVNVIPNYAFGYASSAQNVFGFVTNYDLSSVIKYSAYDNDQTYPTTASLTTTANRVLTGSTVNDNISMVSLYDTTDHQPATVDWKTTWFATTAGNNPNRLAGGFDSGDNYVTQLGSIPTAAVSGEYDSTPQCTFNMLVTVPSDAETTDSWGFDLAVQYTYTSTAPTPKFQFNNADQGDEATPSWGDITGTSTTYGVYHCRDDSTSTAPYANIPSSTTEDTAKAWVTSA